MDNNKTFRAIGCLTCLANGSAFTGLVTAWILKALGKAGFLPNPLVYSLLFVIPFLGIIVWKLWQYEYQSEDANLAEKFYRGLPLAIWFAAYILGVIHFL